MGALGAILLSCLGHAADAAAQQDSADHGFEVAQLAREYVGSRYAWGGSSPAGFDCTGFVQFVYRQFGVELPRSEAGQLA
ncbi:MAG: C40 family peptidase, partial [Chloroflexota bacterium]|nr:C40 family peptidase [Chloroflexota bacterium]